HYAANHIALGVAHYLLNLTNDITLLIANDLFNITQHLAIQAHGFSISTNAADDFAFVIDNFAVNYPPNNNALSIAHHLFDGTDNTTRRIAHHIFNLPNHIALLISHYLFNAAKATAIKTNGLTTGVNAANHIAILVHNLSVDHAPNNIALRIAHHLLHFCLTGFGAGTG